MIDVEEKHLVVEIETAAAKKTTLQKVSLTGDPFHLYLPRRHTDLPAYSAKADYLPWNHCPVCHDEVQITEGQSWVQALEAHTLKAHKLCLKDVRRMVIETAMLQGPQSIGAQIMRTCLHRFRSELTDASFLMKPCACCTHGFVSKDLQTVRFPAFDSSAPDSLPDLPGWLIDWDLAAWKQEGAA